MKMLNVLLFLTILQLFGGIDCDGLNTTTCGIPSPQCDDSNLIIEAIECDALGDYLPGFHSVYYKCKEDENKCYEMVGTSGVHHWPFDEDTQWTECPVCKKFEGNCSIPKQYPGAVMTYTGTSCGSKVEYKCTVGEFEGFDRDRCIRYLNATANKHEMRWHSEINDQPHRGCVKLCNSTNMKIKCGETKLPTKSGTADLGQQIEWIPQEGFSLMGQSSSVCQENGTWSNDVPCCVAMGQESPCPQQNVENGVVNRVQVGNGCNYQYTVTCNSGYEAFGPVTYECGPMGMTPRFATRCIPEGSCGGCLPLPVVSNSTVTGFGGTWTQSLCWPQIVYECDPGCTILGGTMARCVYYRGSVRLPYNPLSCDC